MKERRQSKRGYTLVEMMVVIAIIAVVAAIAIPSIIAIRRNLEFKRVNENAKAVFLAAQNNLVEMRAAGKLEALREDANGSISVLGANHVSGDPNVNGGFPEADWSSQYFYTTSRSAQGQSGDDYAYNLVLPVNSIESDLRDASILIEYNPRSGNVYSVFYSEKEDVLVDESGKYLVTREESARKARMLGYYNGSGVVGNVEDVFTQTIEGATIEYISGQEGKLRISVPIPDEFITRPESFLHSLNVQANVVGELTGGTFTIPADQFEKHVEFGSNVIMECVLDSLANQQSFASWPWNNNDGTEVRWISGISSQDSMKILPGENVSIQTDFSYEDELGSIIEVAQVGLSKVNPMFDSAKAINKNGVEMYELYISNGRHLQNLNLVAPAVGEIVDAVYITADIDWSATVSYYTRLNPGVSARAAGGSVKSDSREAPGRMLPYFVPISNHSLFGSAYFTDGSILSSSHRFPALNDYNDLEHRALVEGGNHRIYNLNVDGSKLIKQVNGRTENVIGTRFYAQTRDAQPDSFVGLFAYANTTIRNLNVVNSTFVGADLGHPAAGSLVGATGCNAFLYNCGAYIDTGYSPVEGERYVPGKSYGVTGFGSVGGLVGYTNSHRTISGSALNVQDASKRDQQLSFSNCFASVYVNGSMDASVDNLLQMASYTNGVGGLVGTSILSNYYNCYSASTVNAKKVYVSDLTNQNRYRGAGGFVGTVHGSQFYNCFAAGDVDAARAYADLGYDGGVGGFVGIIYNNEAYHYQDLGQLVGGYGQFSQFRSCYALGNVKFQPPRSNSAHYHSGFSGWYTEGTTLYCSATWQFGPFQLDGWRRISAPTVTRNWLTGEVKDDQNYYTASNRSQYDFKQLNYLYKDTYYRNIDFLNNADRDDHGSDGTIGVSVAYDDFKNLPGYQLSLANDPENADNRNAYQNGFVNWHNVTAQNTHPYSMNASGAFPFSMPAAFGSYYGNWPDFRQDVVLAYFEQYEDGTDGFWAFSDALSSLRSDKKVINDGYCILSASKEAVKANIGGTNDEGMQELHWNNTMGVAGEVTINGTAYYVFPISPVGSFDADNLKALENKAVQKTAEAFYTKITVQAKENRVEQIYTFYYNPSFALTQRNPVGGSKEAERPDGIPENIFIRSARQLYNLSQSPAFWTAECNYIQQLDVDAEAYQWTQKHGMAKPNLSPIGLNAYGETDAKPFNGTYEGGMSLTENGKAAIVGFHQVPGVDGGFGLFGNVGLEGVVRNLRIESTDPVTLNLPANLKNIGLVAAVNNGIVEGIEVKAVGDLTIEAPGARNVGLVVGSNFGGTNADGETTGIVSGISVSVGKIAMDGQNVGGIVGSSSGTVSADITAELVSGNASSGTGYTGGMVGMMTGGSLTGGMEVKTVQGKYTGTDGKTNVGGVVGCLGGELKSGKVTLDTVSSLTGTAAGIAGEVRNGTVSGFSVTIENEVSGSAGASGAFGQAQKLTASNVDVVIDDDAQVTATNGSAAGFALNMSDISSSIQNGTVTLRGKIAAADSAAGFVSSAVGTIEDSKVYLNGSRGVDSIKGGAGAAGFAAQNMGTIQSSLVAGTCVIQSNADAAGFVLENAGTISNSYATTGALNSTDTLRNAYLNRSAEDLQITASGTAAGFAVSSSGHVYSCYALGSISGETAAAGFVGTNDGTIRRAMANVKLSSGSGFVGTNDGSIVAAYTWYDGTASDGFVTDGTGSITGVYCAPMNADAKNLFTDSSSAGTFVDCYALSGSDTIPESPFAEAEVCYTDTMGLSQVHFSALDSHSGSTNWVSSTEEQYPYSARLSRKTYPLPLLASISQFGDWNNTKLQAPADFGVLYYEYGTDGKYYIGQTEIIQSNGWDAETVSSLFDSMKTLEDMDADGVKAAKFGYALFTNDPFEFSDVIKDETKLFDLVRLKRIACYAISEANADVENGTALVSSSEFYVNPYFANAINVDGSDSSQPLVIRTALQLRNTRKPDGNRFFKLGRDIDYTGMGSIDSFGDVLNGNEKTISNVQNANLFGTLSGSVSNLTLNNLKKSIAETVAANGKLKDITVKNGTVYGLAAAVHGTIENLTVEGDVTAAMFGTVSGTVKNLNLETLKARIAEKVTETGAVICDPAADGAAQEYNTIGYFESDGGMFGEVSGVLGYIKVEEAKVTKSDISKSTDIGILTDVLSGNGSIGCCVVNSAAMSADVKTSGIESDGQIFVNMGAAVGAANGGELKDVQISDLSMAIKTKQGNSGNQGNRTANYAVGGLVGNAVKNGDILTNISMCHVSYSAADNSAAAENVTIDINNRYGAKGSVHFGGLVGNAEAEISHSSVKALNLSKAALTSSNNSSNFASIPMSVGGLVGVMGENAKLLASSAGEEGTPIVLNIGGSNKQAATYNVGGAVGEEISQNVSTRASYGKLDDKATVANVSIKPSNLNSVTLNAGQFIGKATNGSFNSCEGWSDDGFDFYGDIEKKVTAINDALLSQNPNVPVSGTTKASDEYVHGSTTVEEYNVELTNCTYEKGGKVLQKYIGFENYLYQETVLKDIKTVYEAEKLAPTMEHETKQMRSWQAPSATTLGGSRTKDLSGYYHLIDGEYYRAISLTATRTGRLGAYVDVYDLKYWDGSAEAVYTTNNGNETLTLYKLKAATVSTSADYMLAVFSEGTGYILTKNGDQVQTEVLDAEITEQTGSFTLAEPKDFSTAVWKSGKSGRTNYPFAELKISNGGLTVSGSVQTNAVAGSGEKYYTVANGGNRVFFDTASKQFTGSAASGDQANVYLYEITNAHEVETEVGYQYERMETKVDTMMMEREVEMTRGGSTELEAIDPPAFGEEASGSVEQIVAKREFREAVNGTVYPIVNKAEAPEKVVTSEEAVATENEQTVPETEATESETESGSEPTESTPAESEATVSSENAENTQNNAAEAIASAAAESPLSEEMLTAAERS